MSAGVRTRGGWISLPIWVWIVIGPYILFGWLMWLLVKWGSIGLFLLTAASCKQLAKLTRTAFAAWQRHRALAHP